MSDNPAAQFHNPAIVLGPPAYSYERRPPKVVALQWLGYNAERMAHFCETCARLEFDVISHDVRTDDDGRRVYSITSSRGLLDCPEDSWVVFEEYEAPVVMTAVDFRKYYNMVEYS